MGHFLGALDHLAEELPASKQRPDERLFFQSENLGDPRFGRLEFGKIVSHRRDKPGKDIGQKGPLKPEHPPIADRSPQNFPQHIAPIGIARLHAVGDRERETPDMVGDHMEGGSENGVLTVVFFSRNFFDLCDESAKDVGLEYIVDPDFQGGDPLEARSRVDRLFGKVFQFARSVARILHEDEVPEFEIALAGRVVYGAFRRAVFFPAVV